ncbi:MAG: 50S ribosomal protein L29 [Clostridia bacterium]|jgi:large subunit ribosomal protein L29|nr:50S ribosomal protein L29 [Clostridia bacterium]MDD4570973.1 50S ribosomal protein L29 [Clostridia bacterium]
MKAKDVRDLTDEELVRKVDDLKTELFNLRFRMATGQLDNPLVISNLKKDLARVKTIIREREIKKAEA